ncbi:small ribosomal subunit protein uS15m-like [Atheta coriaria]|uniref:small ribosomal subunit protein uS15m-like n=1 Tax=Dalotia coriaria TaxID=877792 RepID=UPI0031F4136E
MNSIRTLLIKTRLDAVQLRNYAFKSDLKIKWVRPEKISCIKPQKSGDLEPMPQIKNSQLAYDFRNSKELETADELVRRLFTLEFQPRKKATQVYIRSVVANVNRHDLDKGSIEARIARWTGAIRALQEQAEKFPRNLRLKVNLKELIDKRKKHLKYLRRWDYKKFEWLLESLNIVYKPPPNEFRWVVRRESLVKLTKKYCDQVTDDKLEEYRMLLAQEHPAFLEEKARTLEFLRDEQRECGMEVTITQEEIDAAKAQLLKIQQEASLKTNETN